MWNRREILKVYSLIDVEDILGEEVRVGHHSADWPDILPPGLQFQPYKKPLFY